jgi:hypothetical protein
MKREQGYRGAAARRMMKKPQADYDPEAEFEAEQANIPDEELPQPGHIHMDPSDSKAAQNIYGALLKKKQTQEQED